jgi:putative transposase
MPYHVRQRGNNRQACFFEVADYQHYLDLLSIMLKRYQVSLHAYVLMTNHVHLLMTAEDKEGISQVMKVVASRYAYHMNKSYGRTGSLWEGRHKSSVVDSENYLLTCYRYIELNPVSAQMVGRPEEYEWSSYTANAWGDGHALITPHEAYLGLSKNVETRLSRYRALFDEKLRSSDIEAIRLATHYCQPLGDDLFRQQIESKLGRKVGQSRKGRPKKSAG